MDRICSVSLILLTIVKITSIKRKTNMLPPSRIDDIMRSASPLNPTTTYPIRKNTKRSSGIINSPFFVVFSNSRLCFINMLYLMMLTTIKALPKKIIARIKYSIPIEFSAACFQAFRILPLPSFSDITIQYILPARNIDFNLVQKSCIFEKARQMACFVVVIAVLQDTLFL